MNTNLPLFVAGCVFAFVALMHLLRLFFKVEITIAGKSIPFWVSAFGFFIPCSLATWMFIAGGCS